MAIYEPCPTCRRPIDLTSRVTGDTIWCVCGALLRVEHRNGFSVLIKTGSTNLAERGRPRRRSKQP